MPIRPENLGRYPKNWRQVAAAIKSRAGHRCECLGECGVDHEWDRCREFDKTEARTFRGRVILTVAHLDHTPENCAPGNLRAYCQACHNRYDTKHRINTRRRTRDNQAGQSRMPWADEEAKPTVCHRR